jgi:hypothetical protein
MTCYLCNLPIETHHQINWHHPEYKSNGGTDTEPTHHLCHVEYHSSQGDFRRWGRQGGLIASQSKRWAFNLLNVRNHPTYTDTRNYYRTNYAYAGWGEGI